MCMNINSYTTRVSADREPLIRAALPGRKLSGESLCPGGGLSGELGMERLEEFYALVAVYLCVSPG